MADIVVKKTPATQRNDIFWGEIAPCEHLVQFYNDEEEFMTSLEQFVIAGLKNGEGVIVIATLAHRIALEERLLEHGIDLALSQANGQLVLRDATQTLSQFILNGWPDPTLFKQVVRNLLQVATQGNRQARAFGEMVAVLWAAGHNGATVRLEHLWHEFCEAESFSLFCAYPKTGVTLDASTSMQEICSLHSQVLASPR